MSQHESAVSQPHTRDGDAKPGWGQLDPSVKNGNGYVVYEMADLVTGNPIATVLVTNGTVPRGPGGTVSFEPNTEYWRPAGVQSRFNTDDYRGGLRVDRVEHAWTEAPTLSPSDARVFKQPVYQQNWPIMTHTHSFQTVGEGGRVDWGFRVAVELQSGAWKGSVQWMKQVDALVVAMNGNTELKSQANVQSRSCVGELR